MSFPENITSLSDELNAVIKKYFPESWSSVRAERGLSKPFIGVSFGGVSRDDVPNGILQNDPCFHSYIVWCENHEQDKFQIEVSVCGIMVEPTNKMYAMETASDSPRLRKYTGSAEQLIKIFDKHVAKVRQVWLNNYNDIYQGHKYSDKYWN